MTSDKKSTGYFPLYRSVQDDWMWPAEGEAWHRVHVFLWLRFRARVTPKKIVRMGKVVFVGRGQCEVNLTRLADDASRSRKWIRAQLDLGIKAKTWTTAKPKGAPNGVTLVTFLNYERYSLDGSGAGGNDIPNDIPNGGATDTPTDLPAAAQRRPSDDPARGRSQGENEIPKDRKTEISGDGFKNPAMIYLCSVSTLATASATEQDKAAKAVAAWDKIHGSQPGACIAAVTNAVNHIQSQDPDRLETEPHRRWWPYLAKLVVNYQSKGPAKGADDTRVNDVIEVWDEAHKDVFGDSSPTDPPDKVLDMAAKSKTTKQEIYSAFYRHFDDEKDKGDDGKPYNVWQVLEAFPEHVAGYREHVKAGNHGE